jgi:hypothetical protein
MADYLKLFQNKRLSPGEPHHLDYIKGRLANMRVEDPKAYEEYSQYYGVKLDVEVTKVPTFKNDGKPKKVKAKA